MANVKELVADPQWFPDGFDAGRGIIRFARMTREAVSENPFLDERKSKSVSGWADARVDDLISNTKPAPAPAFIFHSAFCGSTLLARALDVPGKTLPLKEPNILLDLVNARRVTPSLQSGSNYEKLASVVVSLLGRRHKEDERIVIKPTNSASPFAPFAFKLNCPSLFLYGSLNDFLVSILKKREEGRAFVRQQFNIFALDRTGLSGIEPRKAMSLTDLQVAALIWRHQLEEFSRFLNMSPSAASIEFAAIIAKPGAALSAVARHFSLPLNREEIEAAASGPIFLTNSKFANEAFDAEKRKAENNKIKALFDVELKLISSWIETINLGVEMKTPLSRALKL